VTISSRTTEGRPGSCGVCGHSFRIEISDPFGEAPCPACGTLLWNVSSRDGPQFFDPETTGLLDWISTRLGIDRTKVRPAQLQDLNSLDMVELIMELEDQRE